MSPKNKSILLAIALPLVFIASIQLLNAFPFPELFDFKQYAMGVIGTLIALIISYLFLKKENTSFRTIGLVWESKTPKRFFIGFLIGTAIVLVMITSIILLSDLKVVWKEGADVSMALFWLGAFLPLAFMEEIIFRGYSFLQLNKVVGLRLTQIMMAILFAYWHDASGATLMGQLMGPGIWALIFGIATVWSDGLALPTGLHMAANVVQAVLGMKEDKYAIWVIDYQQEMTESMQAHTATMGFIVQIALLIVGVFMTEWYLRRKKGFEPNKYYL